mmetsp:Transcript_13109/g.31824  ORF Transcript_13109/g.31824 Transcript_13109/m.31824 type:complete len:236 (+) Transcript_13109:503-1210(+)
MLTYDTVRPSCATGTEPLNPATAEFSAYFQEPRSSLRRFGNGPSTRHTSVTVAAPDLSRDTNRSTIDVPGSLPRPVPNSSRASAVLTNTSFQSPASASPLPISCLSSDIVSKSADISERSRLSASIRSNIASTTTSASRARERLTVFSESRLSFLTLFCCFRLAFACPSTSAIMRAPPPGARAQLAPGARNETAEEEAAPRRATECGAKPAAGARVHAASARGRRALDVHILVLG